MLSNSEKGIAEAASHEAGHNLGLSHDDPAASYTVVSPDAVDIATTSPSPPTVTGL